MGMTQREKLEAKRIAEKYDLSVPQVVSIVKSQYQFIREKVVNLDLPRDLSEEEFYKRTKNFNIPSIGKMYASYAVYKRINKL